MMAKDRLSTWGMIGLYLAFFCVARVQFCSGVDTPPQARQLATTARSRRISGAYCGIYCVYAAAKMLGCDTDFGGLLKREYIPRPQGSSLRELAKAAKDQGMYAEPVGNLTSYVLQTSPYKIILHVRSRAGAENYDHYVLFYGSSGSKALLLDAPRTPRLVPFHELASIWDGTGLVISTEPIDLRALFAPSRIRFALGIATAAVLVVLCRLAGRRLSAGVPSLWRCHFILDAGQGMSMIVVAMGLAFACHFISDEGLLTNAQATQAIQQAHAGAFIPKIREAKVHDLMGNGAVLVDARLGADYRAGHLDRAISVPVDTNDVWRRERTASIPRESKVVVYCQSNACTFAENVALWLKDHGFSDVAVYRGGWVDWVAKNGRKNTEGKS